MLMNKLALIFAFSFISISAEAQNSDLSFESGEKQFAQNEIGINLFNVTHRWPQPYYNRRPFQQKYLTGWTFKHHFNKNTFRIGFDYNNSDYALSGSTGYSYFKDEGHSNLTKLRAGLERKFGNKNLKPYMFVDLEFASGDIKGTRKGASDIIGSEYEAHYNLKVFEYGISAGAGLHYQLTYRFSISVESNFSNLFYNNFDLGADYGGVSYTILFNPIRLLSINYTM